MLDEPYDASAHSETLATQHIAPPIPDATHPNTDGLIVAFAALAYAVCSGDGFPRKPRSGEPKMEDYM